ncbi:MAG TPA: NADH-quinone oxidoreductase subunit NuoG [Acidimicrobiia bacterium]|nr:NADH-quinone oxidoreductase subunit NuoG [Acidimicrobiia bacterium]
MTSGANDSKLVRVTINGVEHEVPEGELLIKAAQDRGTYIPRFCWHPRMNPVGMCRMCLVEIETPRGPMIVTACTNLVSDGMVVDTENATVEKAQEAILEFLLANHPLDCPVCDKGGECPLQDQTLAYGPGESRFVEIKRTFEKPIPISDLVLLDRERCILCARCTRFSDEISGDPLIEFKDRGNTTEVNTFPDLPFSSYFSGNTVQICPVGALTAKPYRFKARPWDLRRVESSSMFDTAHPRIEIHASQNQILRYTGVDMDATNHGWLSDKDRFGFEYLGSEHRLTHPLVKRDGEFVEVDWAEALDIVATRLGLIKDEDGGDALAVVGGAGGTNEDAYVISRFAREVLETSHVDCRMDDSLDSHFLAATVDRGLISEVDEADTILVWGPDLKEEHPTLYLRVRRAAQELGKTLIVIHPRATGLDDRANFKLTYRPGGGFDLLREIADNRHPELTEVLSDRQVVVLAGIASVADGPNLAESVAAAIRDIAGATRILPLNSRANTFGALDMGLAPDLLPGRVNPGRPGKGTREIMEGLDAGDIRGLVLVGADPLRDMPDSRTAVAGLDTSEYIVAIDLFRNDSNEHADVILPAAGFAEKEGTITNLEGRVQKVNRVRPAPGSCRPDWSIIDDLSTEMGRPLGLASAETIAKEISESLPLYAGVTHDHLEWEARDGVVVPIEGSQPFDHIPVVLDGPRAPGAEFTVHRARTMYDDGVRLRHSPSLHRLAPGAVARLNPADAPGIGVKEGARVRVTTSQGEGEFLALLDPGTPRGVVHVPLNQPGGTSLGTDPVARLKVLRTQGGAS